MLPAWHWSDTTAERFAAASWSAAGSISHDARLGLAPRERSYVVARFLDDLDPALRDELRLLVRRRCAAAKRIADTLEPVELVFEGCDGREHRMTGRIEPPVERSGGLRIIAFGLRDAPP